MGKNTELGVSESVAFLLCLEAGVLLGGCSSREPLPSALDVGGDPGPDAAGSSVIIDNQGGDMEGHTPRGFEGTGEGLFAGDDVNPDFPPGEGVQFFVTFELGDPTERAVRHAEMRSSFAQTSGRPFDDLGPLVAEETRYTEFSAALFDAPPESTGFSCAFATSLSGPFSCDVTEVVRRSVADGYPYAQFRFRFAEVSDGDGEPDIAAFFITDSNTNEPGIFELELTR